MSSIRYITKKPRLFKLGGEWFCIGSKPRRWWQLGGDRVVVKRAASPLWAFDDWKHA